MSVIPTPEIVMLFDRGELALQLRERFDPSLTRHENIDDDEIRVSFPHAPHGASAVLKVVHLETHRLETASKELS